MTEFLITRSAAGFEAVGDGWTVHGLAVPYGKATKVSDDGTTFYLETFATHSFQRDCEKGGRWVNLMLGHQGDEGDRYLGRCVGLMEDSQGLWSDFRIDRAHPQAEAARSGELRGWSISARVYRSRRELGHDMPHVIRESCGLSHVAATPVPQYAGAGVLVARDHELIDSPSPTPRLDALRAKGFGAHG
jgi:Escherichia/Staphylococcus phage prohead protease